MSNPFATIEKAVEVALDGTQPIRTGRKFAVAQDTINYAKEARGIVTRNYYDKYIALIKTEKYDPAWFHRALTNTNIFKSGVFKDANEIVEALYQLHTELGDSDNVIRLFRRLRINHGNAKGFAAELKFASESETLVNVSRDMKPDKGIDVDVEDAFLNQCKYSDFPVDLTPSLKNWIRWARKDPSGKAIRILVKKGGKITKRLENYITNLAKNKKVAITWRDLL